jgi:hypothetical protein
MQPLILSPERAVSKRITPFQGLGLWNILVSQGVALRWIIKGFQPYHAT